MERVDFQSRNAEDCGSLGHVALDLESLSIQEKGIYVISVFDSRESLGPGVWVDH